MTPSVAVFGPDPLLSIAIEPRAGDGDEIHVHAAGQGVWVARMAAELGVRPVLCAFLGGESGDVVRRLLESSAIELRAVSTAGSTGSYVVERSDGQRRIVASALRPALRRHEIDDLVGETVVAARDSSLLAICNPYPGDGLPGEVYETLTAGVKAAGVPVLVDLSSPRLEHTLRHQPDLVKLNDWELAEYVRGPVNGAQMLEAARRLIGAGARAVAVTRAERPILVVPGDGEPYEVLPPTLAHGFREGCGDTMMGAIAAAWAQGSSLQSAIVLGAAAGSVNFLRHGLGTGKRGVIHQMAKQVSVRPLATGRPGTRTAA